MSIFDRFIAKKSPEPSKERKEQRDKVAEIIEHDFQNPYEAETPCGEFICATSMGLSQRKGLNENQDCPGFYMDKESKSIGIVVSDGMGGMGRHGKEGGRVVTQAVLDAWQQQKNVSQETQNVASQRMREKNLDRESGACYAAAYIKDGYLHVAQAGDVRVQIFGADGVIRFENTLDQVTEGRHKGSVNNAIDGNNPGECKSYRPERLLPNDTVIIEVDGSWKNRKHLENERYRQDIAKKSPRDAMRQLHYDAENRMIQVPNDADNLTIGLLRVPANFVAAAESQPAAGEITRRTVPVSERERTAEDTRRTVSPPLNPDDTRKTVPPPTEEAGRVRRFSYRWPDEKYFTVATYKQALDRAIKGITDQAEQQRIRTLVDGFFTGNAALSTIPVEQGLREAVRSSAIFEANSWAELAATLNRFDDNNMFPQLAAEIKRQLVNDPNVTEITKVLPRLKQLEPALAEKCEELLNSGKKL